MPANRPPNEGWRRYRRAGLAAAAVASVSLVTTAAPATAETPAVAADPTGELHVVTQTGAERASVSELAAQIDGEETQADELAEAADAAQVQLLAMTAREEAARAAVQVSDGRLSRTHTVLARQAVAAYLQSGRALTPMAPTDVADNPALIDGYAGAIANEQTSTLATYEALRRRQEAAVDTLGDAVSADQASAEQLTAAERQAQDAVATAEATLAEVRSQPALASAVTDDETAAYDRSAPSVEAHFGVPAGSPVGAAPDGLPATTAAGGPAGPPAPVTTPATAPQAPVEGPPTTSPTPTTVAPATADTTAPVGATTVTTAAPAPVTATTIVPTTLAPTTTAPTTTAPRTTTTLAPSPTTAPAGAGSGSAISAPGSSEAIAYARAQLGKPYAWGGAGPDSFDCSGLVMVAWGSAGVSFPHSAQLQYDDTTRVAISALQPGDLVFYGTPTDVYHVGIYIGAGEMIDAPHTGADVRIEGIYWSDLLAGGRPG